MTASRCTAATTALQCAMNGTNGTFNERKVRGQAQSGPSSGNVIRLSKLSLWFMAWLFVKRFLWFVAVKHLSCSIMKRKLQPLSSQIQVQHSREIKCGLPLAFALAPTSWSNKLWPSKQIKVPNWIFCLLVCARHSLRGLAVDGPFFTRHTCGRYFSIAQEWCIINYQWVLSPERNLQKL